MQIHCKAEKIGCAVTHETEKTFAMQQDLAYHMSDGSQATWLKANEVFSSAPA